MKELPINRIICGDCLKIIKNLPDNNIELTMILTDPPYVEDSRFEGSFSLIKKVSNLLATVTSKNSWLVSDFFRPNIKKYIEAYENSNWKFYDLVTAFVINSMANCAFGVDRFTPSLCFKKGEAKIKAKYSNVIQITRKSYGKGWTGHPSQKNIELYCKYILMLSSENDIILDPFCGSGTACMAAKMLNRRYIGIDISKEYCKMSRQRLKQITRGSRLGLFDKIKSKKKTTRKPTLL